MIERCVCEPATSPSDDLTFTAWLDDSVALGEHQDVQAGVFAIRGYCNRMWRDGSSSWSLG